MSHLVVASATAFLYGSVPLPAPYHSITFLAIMLSGHRVASEAAGVPVAMANARIDTVLETPDTFYIFEFKANSSAQEALSQIADRAYTEAYLNQGKKVVAVGIAFYPETRSVKEWKEVVVGG